MKQIIKVLLSTMFLFGIIMFSSLFHENVEAATSDIYTYTVSDGEATITDCDASTSGSITIPSSLGGYPVTSIDNYAFLYCSKLISVTIPVGVTNIGSHAFSYCSSLASVTIPDSVTSIGILLFEDCIKLAQS